MQEREEKIEKIILDAVDEGLKTLGESGKQAIFFHLERTYSIKKSDIPKKPDAFAEGLEKIFGGGATVIQKIILENLYSKLGLKYEDRDDYSFTDYLNDIKSGKEDLRSRSTM